VTGLLHRLAALPDGADAPVRHAPAATIRAIVRRFWPYARPYRLRLAASLFLTLLVPAIGAAQIWMFKLVVDEVLVPRDFGPFLPIAAGYVGLTLLLGIVAYGADYLSAWIAESFLLELRTSVFRHVQGLSLEFFERTRLGDLLARLTADVAAIETFVLSGVTRAVSYAAQIGVIAAVLLYLEWQLALPVLLVVPLLWLFLRRFTRLVKSASREKRRRNGSLSALAEESLANAQLVQAYNRQASEVARFRQQNAAAFEAELAVTRLKAALEPVLDLLRVGVALAVIGLGLLALRDGRLSLGGLIVFLTYVGMLYSPIKGAGRLTNSLFAATAGAERIIELLDERPSVLDPSTGRRLARAEGRVEFDRVSFAYGAARRAALDDVSFAIAPGETIALVGRSGAGKSTVARLLLRFYDPQAGSIRLDGIDLRALRLESLRDNIALVLQEMLVFDGTIRENIAYGRPGADERAIERAARAADAHDFIASLPLGYDTPVGQRGRRLSGGQAQRVAVARALVREAPLLILDEPTTGVDAASSERIVGPLRRLMAERTTIVISHDLLTVRDADRLLVLDEGRIAETGTHAELLRRGGIYAGLFRLHAAASAPPLTVVERR
jgi:ATP-binding cassette, subfamily B, bacterial